MSNKFLDLDGVQVIWTGAKNKFGVSIDCDTHNNISKCILLKNASGNVIDYLDTNSFLEFATTEDVDNIFTERLK